MDINKVLKKQKKSYIRFMLSMGFIFLLLPITLWFTKQFNSFFLIYLIIIEILIIVIMIMRYNEEYLKFELINDKIIISMIGGRSKYKFTYSKVAIVHTLPQTNDDFDILIVTKSNFRNKKMRVLTKKALEKYLDIEKHYRKISTPTDGAYYYFVVRRGKAKKYILLDLLYKYAVSAIFTESAVNNIKEYRKLNSI